MKGYGQFCPVAKACEVLAERWTPLVLRELLCGSRRFNDLQRGVPLMSRSLLVKRLRELEDAGLLEQRGIPDDRRGNEYHLTPAGEAVRPIIENLGAWGQRWLGTEIAPDDADPSLLMWDIRRNLCRSALPERRVVVRFEFKGVSRGRRRWWLVLDQNGGDLCLTNPGFSVDVEIVADVRDFTRYWIGRMSWPELVQVDGFEIRGPNWIRRSVPQWLGRSTFSALEQVKETNAS